jgi:nitronate monooxygenase
MKRNKWAKTKVTRLLSINYPVIQGPFGGGLSSVLLTTTVSNLGGLGSFGCQPYTVDEIIAFSKAIRKQTSKPFNLNLWVNDRDEKLTGFDNAAYKKLKEVFKPYFDELAIPLPEMPFDFGPKYEDQVQAILETKPPVFSFMYGVPSEDILEQCRRNNTITIGTITTVDEAIALEKAGVDAIVATGFEAGGHRASFIRSAEDSLTGLFALIPQVADNVSIPVIAAGGIADARGVKAALTLGADAVQIGTALLATDQSNATREHKQKLFSAEAKYTTLTKAFSGRLARIIRSKLTEELKDKEHLLAPYPLQRKFMSSLSAAVIKNQKTEYSTFASGQSAPLLKYKDATEFFLSLIDETNQLYF